MPNFKYSSSSAKPPIYFKVSGNPLLMHELYIMVKIVELTLISTVKSFFSVKIQVSNKLEEGYSHCVPPKSLNRYLPVYLFYK